PKAGANVGMAEVREDGEGPRRPAPGPPGAAANLIGLGRGGTLSHQAAKRVFGEVAERGGEPRNVAEALGLIQVADTGVVTGWVSEVLAANPTEVTRYKSGEVKLLQFFVGQVMKVS